jgi:hypothetical protein
MKSCGPDHSGFRVVLCLAVVIIQAQFVGCGSRDQGWVSGQVLYKGQPVTGGLVSFVPADTTRRPVSAQIDANGRYQTYAPIGDVKIAVDNRELQPEQSSPGGFVPPGIKLPPMENKGEVKENPAAPRRPPGVYVAIPEEYYDVRTSGLHYTVQTGSQSHDIELTEIRPDKRRRDR